MLTETKQYLALIRFSILVSHLIFLDFVVFGDSFSKNIYLETHLQDMFSTKCQVQNDHTNREKISCVVKICNLNWIFNQNLDFSAPALLHSLCLINSFHRRYVSCMYNWSNISKVSNISIISNYINYIQVYQLYQLYPTISTISIIQYQLYQLYQLNQLYPLSNHYLRTNRANISPQ